MCVGETAQKTKREEREKKESDCRKRVALSKATPSPPGLFSRYICLVLTKAALCAAAAAIVALGRRPDVCFTLSFLRLALKFGNIKIQFWTDVLSVFLRTTRPSSMPERTMLFMLF